MNTRRIKKIMVHQSSASDCGVACLKTVFHYFGTHVSLELLRVKSGTTETGTTILGLYQCAEAFGFEAEAGESNEEYLFKLEHPSILLVRNERGAGHYIVYFPNVSPKKTDSLHFIGDPANGLLEVTTKKLLSMWESRALLVLKPGKRHVPNQPDRLRWLLSYLSADPQLLTGIMLMSVIIALLGFAATLFSQKLIDDLLPKHDFNKIIYGLTLLVIVMCGRNVLFFLRSLFINTYAIRFQELFAGALIGKIFFKPLHFFMQFSPGEILARVGDAGKIQKAIIYVAAISVIDLLYVFFAITYLAFISPYIGLIAFLFIPLCWIAGQYHSRRLFRGNQLLLEAGAKFEQGMIDGLQGHAVYRENAREHYILEKLKRSLSGLTGAADPLTRSAAHFQLLGDTLSTLLYAGIIVFATFEVADKVITTGQVVVVFSIQATLSITIQRLMSSVLVLLEGRAAAVKIYNLADCCDGSQSVLPVPAEAVSLQKLTFSKLSFRFPGRMMILNELCLEVEKGATVAITGKSGSGKSLLMQLLIGSLAPTSGQIICNIDGTDIRTPFDRRSIIGHVPQQVYAFEGTIAENIALDSAAPAIEGAIKMCAVLGFIPFFALLPNEMETMVGTGHLRLSEGQKQLLGIARALYKKPQLLILDEATSAMDEAMSRAVRSAIAILKKDMIIIWVTHEKNIIDYCDKRLHISSHGRD